MAKKDFRTAKEIFNDLYGTGGLRDRVAGEIMSLGATKAAKKTGKYHNAISTVINGEFPKATTLIEYAEKLGIE